jgi:hypothetical protein
MDALTLATGLEEWFAANRDNPNRWHRGIVGQTIKRQLQGTGNWKNAPRGDARAAGLARVRKVAIEVAD